LISFPDKDSSIYNLENAIDYLHTVVELSYENDSNFDSNRRFDSELCTYALIMKDNYRFREIAEDIINNKRTDDHYLEIS
jgi:hypothetical protein